MHNDLFRIHHCINAIQSGVECCDDGGQIPLGRGGGSLGSHGRRGSLAKAGGRRGKLVNGENQPMAEMCTFETNPTSFLELTISRNDKTRMRMRI